MHLQLPHGLTDMAYVFVMLDTLTNSNKDVVCGPASLWDYCICFQSVL